MSTDRIAPRPSPRTKHHRFRARSAIVGSCIFALGACTVTDSRTFKEIPADELPSILNDTVAPTTTTTTTTTTTIPGPTTTVQPTTTVPRPVEEIQIFYVQGVRVRAVSLREPSPVSPQAKLRALIQREGMISDGVRLASVLARSAVLIADLGGDGVITIELSTAVDEVLPADLPLFFAQIVLTALAPSRQGQVVFTQDGEPYPAVRADQTVVEPGAPLAWKDYEELIVGDPRPPVATTTTAWVP